MTVTFACIGSLKQAGSHESHEQPDDGHHHEHFDQGDAGLPGRFRLRFIVWAIIISPRR